MAWRKCTFLSVFYNKEIVPWSLKTWSKKGIFILNCLNNICQHLSQIPITPQCEHFVVSDVLHGDIYPCSWEGVTLCILQATKRQNDWSQESSGRTRTWTAFSKIIRKFLTSGTSFYKMTINQSRNHTFHTVFWVEPPEIFDCSLVLTIKSIS